MKQETELHWRARFFDVDMGTVEIVPINDAFYKDSAVTAIYAKGWHM